jgi:archaellum component FlaG (FlaF/FlaG flagellin family)
MVVVCIVFFMSGVAVATMFTDDFNRTDVGPTTDGTVIGANYVNSITGTGPLKDWQISTNKLVFPEPGYVAGGNAVLYNTSIQTLTSAEGSSFRVEADVTVDISGRWVGVAFNYQNPTNYYALRVSQSSGLQLQYQFVQVVDGVLVAKVSTSETAGFTLGKEYHLSVSYEQTSDTYTFLIKNGSTVMNTTTSSILGSALDGSFDDGFGGVYASGINMNPTYDNLLVESIVASPAGVFTDDFNRADVGPTTSGTDIGLNYVNSIAAEAVKDWQISTNKLVFPEPAFVAGGNPVLFNTSVQTLTSATGAAFQVEADVTVDINGRWVGVAFNYQNPTNFYGLRICQYQTLGFLSYQFVQVVDGTLTAVVNGTGAAFTLGNTYNISASYEQATDTYTFLVKDGETVMNGITNILGSALDGSFDDGYGGVYCSGINENPTFDNLRIESSLPYAPDADEDNMLDAWETAYFGNTYRDGTLDWDADGFTDLDEFYADLNPTNANSILSMLDVNIAIGTSTVTWVNGGTNADVYLDHRSDFQNGWTNIYTLYAPVAVTNSYSHADSENTGFYRVRAQRP